MKTEESHNTKDGYCCACEYDIAGFEARLEESRASALDETVKEIRKIIPVIYCTANKYRDDGVHITFRCPDCSQQWGEENQSPVCLDPVIRLHDINEKLSALTSAAERIKRLRK